MKQNITLFVHPQRLKQLLVKVILMTYLNRFIVQLYQIYKKTLEKGLGWIIDLVTVNVSKYKLLSDRRFFFTEKITPSKKGLFFKTLMIMNALNGVWSKTYLLQIMIKIRKVDKTFARELEFEDIKFPKIIRDIHKIEKEKNYIAIGVFGYENKKKNIQSMCQKIEKTYILFQKTF